MPNPNPDLTARAPFAGLTAEYALGNGVVFTDRDGLRIAAVFVRKGQTEALARRVREHFEIELPRGPQRACAREFAWLGTGPGAWIAIQERGDNAFVGALRDAIGDLASVSDQSDGLAVLRMSGPLARDILIKLLAIDVHPKTFPTSNVVSTAAAHMGVTLWRLDDRAEGEPVFEIAIYRSFAANFWHALTENAAACGCIARDRPT
jgi:heterotetrameric sarcosine oxidase gamma subunit